MNLRPLASVSAFCLLFAPLVASQNPAIVAVARTGRRQDGIEGGSTAAGDVVFEDYEIFTQGYEHQLATSSAGDIDEMMGDYDFDAPEAKSSCSSDTKDGAFANLCELRLEGADVLAKKVPGGIDGVYVHKSCEGGRPTYLRKKSPPSQDRLLWYSTQNRAWDLTNGTASNEEELLLYGGEARDHLRPEYVKDTWFVKTGFDPADHSIGEFEAAAITVTCVSRFKRMKANQPKGNDASRAAEDVKQPRPFLTQKEMDQEYRSAIEPRLQERYRTESRWSASGGASWLSGMVGVAVGVLALLYFLPRCLERRLHRRRAGDGHSWLGLVPLGPKPASS